MSEQGAKKQDARMIRQSRPSLSVPRFTFIALTLSFVSSPAFSQDSTPDQDIRQSAQQILGEPEFRYFEHLGDSPVRPEVRGMKTRTAFGSSDGSGERSGTSDKTGTGDDGKGSSPSRSRSQKNDSSSPNSPNASKSSSSSSFGSGFRALGGMVGMIFHGLAYLVLIAVCGLILYLIVQAILNRESPPAGLTSPMLGLDLPQDQEDHPPGELPADEYLAKAHELAQQGRYREAIGQLLWGGMSSIERAELIRHRRGLTLRDYLRSLRGKSPHYDGFKAMIRLYEPIGFGRRIASDQTFQDALAGYDRAVDGLA